VRKPFFKTFVAARVRLRLSGCRFKVSGKRPLHAGRTGEHTRGYTGTRSKCARLKTYPRALFVSRPCLAQVVNLHYMLSKAQVKARPSVLWCYKKELGFTT